jgi:tetratricopeptide (TPR) repeat protein
MASDKSKILKSAEKYVASGKSAQAIEEYLKVLRDNPKEWNVMIQVGDLYLKLNKTAEAVDQFQKVADHYYSDGFFLKAIAIYKRINKLDPSLTDICMKLADLYLKQGLTMDAKSQLHLVAQSYINKGQNKEAIVTLKKLAEIEPDNLKTRNDLAKAYKAEGMVPEAIKEYLDIGEELIRKGLLKESLAVLETANKLDPKDSDVLQKILSIYLQQNEKAKADALLEEAMKADPSNPDLLGLVAQSQADNNQIEKAHETIDRAIVSSGRKEKLWLMKGDLYLKSGELPKAFSQYSMVVDKQVQRKELQEAISVLQKVTQSDSSFYPAWLRLADLYTMLRQESNVVIAYGSLVDAYIGKGLYQEARKYAKKLIDLEPEDSQHQQKLQFINSSLEQAKTDVKAPAPRKEESLEIQGEESERSAPARSARPERETRSVPRMEPTAFRTPIAPIKLEVAGGEKAIAGPSQEERDFVSEHLIEAEVFNKYGLIDKAMEQVLTVVARYPEAVQARQKLKEIYLEKGERDKAVEECVAMSRIFRKRGDEDQAEDILSEARQINPNHTLLDRAARESAPAVKEPDVLGEIEKLAHSIKAKSGSVKVPGVPKKAQRSTDSILSELFGAQQKPRPASSTKSSAASITSPQPSASHPPSQEPGKRPLHEPGIQELDLGTIEPVKAGKSASLSDEIFEEVDFYTEQGMKEEAKKLLLELQQKHPDNAGIARRLAVLSGEEIAAPAPAEDLLSMDQDEILINLDDFEVPAGEANRRAEAAATPAEPTPDLKPPVEAEAAAENQVAEAVDSGTEETWDLHGVAQSMEQAPVEPEPMEINLGDLELSEEKKEAHGAEESAPTELPGAGILPEAVETEAALEESQSESAENATQLLPVQEEVMPFRGENEEARLYSDAMDAVFTRKEDEQGQAEASVSVKAPEELFEEDDGFFDLAAELEEGFLNVQSAVEEERPPDGQNYSLEEILSDFRKGVEKQLGSEDFDTRYNLGIAYKEMGLVDEAIAEFQVAAKDPRRFLECCSMLGLCFVEKGMPKLAIKWYQRGLDTPGYSDEEYQGLRFELAQAYESVDELDKALEIYQEVYGMNANYRNVWKKIKDLQERLKNK